MNEYIFLPPTLMLGAALLFWLGLRRMKVGALLILGGLALLALACLLIGSLATFGGLGGVAAFALSFYLSIFSIMVGLILTIFLNGRRKLTSIIFIPIFPILLFLSATVGTEFSPEEISQGYGVIIGQRLDHYRIDSGRYPEKLEMLVPAYIDDLRQPTSVWGWLYTAKTDEFTLGYVYWVDWVYSVCVYPSATRKWDCLPNSSGPFDIPPTPAPER